MGHRRLRRSRLSVSRNKGDVAYNKSQVMNKPSSKVNDGWRKRDEAKSKIKKKKLSDCPRWSKEELKLFYKSYREYGTDWKKVAGALHNRTPDMVEALYNLNKKYLSYQEGDAIEVGFIARMTLLHNNVMVNSSNEGIPVEAVALAKPSQESPQISQTQHRIEHESYLPYQLRKRKHAESEINNANHVGIGGDNHCMEDCLRETDSEHFGRYARKINSEGDAVYGAQQTIKLREKGLKHPGSRYHEDENTTEESKGTEGLPLNTENEFESKVSKGKIVRTSFVSRKRSRQLDFGDEDPLFDALRTLALLTVRMSQPASAVESVVESPVHAKEPKENAESSHSSSVQISKSENSRVSCPGDWKKEVSVEEKVSSVGKARALRKQGQLVQNPDCCSLPAALGRESNNLSEPSQNISTIDKTATRLRGRRKLVGQKYLKSSVLVEDKCPVIGGAYDIKGKASHFLISPSQRKWCMFEWFYSGIDYEWFSKCPFIEYLNHVQLEHVKMLTRCEWGIIRSSLGKPRLFCERFLLGERKALEQYRESVRSHYTEMRTGVREHLPKDIVRPLSVGQRIIARHPVTKDIHCGIVLTIDHNHYKVQFDSSEIAVKLMDVDCMPLNQSGPITSSKYPHKMMQQEKAYTIGDILQAKHALDRPDVIEQHVMSSKPCALSPMQATEADMGAHDELTCMLEEKEASLTKLCCQKHEVSCEQKDGDSIGGLDSEQVDDMASLELHDVSEQVGSCLLYSSQCNTSHESSADIPAVPIGSPESFGAYVLTQDPDFPVNDIVEHSRHEAREKVVATMQYQVSTSAEEDEPLLELLSGCVATFSMIQYCAKGKHPPAETMEILERSVASLRPRRSRNLEIFRAIEKHMGIIKAQILMQVPTPAVMVSTQINSMQVAPINVDVDCQM